MVTTNSIRKELIKSSKFIQLFIRPVLICEPKRIIPRTEYMQMMRSNRAPILTRDCKVITKVLKIICRFFPPRFRSLKTLRMRKDLRRVTAPLI